MIAPDFETFARAYGDGAAQVLWVKTVADLETPVSAYLKLAGEEPFCFLLESVEGGDQIGRYSIIGRRPDLIWRCDDLVPSINREAATASDMFEPVEQEAHESLRTLLAESRVSLPPGLPPMAAGGLFGFMGYDMVRLVEDIPHRNPDTLGLPDSVLIRPTLLAIFDNVERVVWLVTPVRAIHGQDAKTSYDRAAQELRDALADLSAPLAVPPITPLDDAGGNGLGEPRSNLTRAQYHKIVEQAREYIFAGDIFQVVPSQRFERPFPLPPFALYRALRRLNPSPFLFFLNFGTFAIVGSSPEILVRVREGVVTIRPIAGTRPRGKTPEEDKALEADLLADPKELAEHLMLLDLGRNDAGRVSEIGSIKVVEKMAVDYYSHVMHIVSTVQGKLRADHDALDALMAGFPAGTVSGAPKVRAMEIIDELETVKRGIYAGSVGYFGADGGMDMCIALRTAVVKDGLMHVQAGGGVVADSDPEAEYQETRNKARALFRAAEEAIRLAGTGTAR